MDPRTLARIHRVRSLQLVLAQGEEARARDRLATEAALGERIAALGNAVAPAPTTASGVSLGAQAHFRARLHASAEAARDRVATAERSAARAADATRAARQDRTAVEKLLERARREALARDMRAMEDMPAAPRNRHDPC